MKKILIISAAAVASIVFLARASDPGTGSWPMWGGTPDRNMVSNQTVVSSWDVKTGKNVKWVAGLGSQSYGNPTVAGGQIYAGTNNELVRDPKEGGDRGVLMCFRESDGEFLWQHTNIKLASGRANDWPFQGVCSSPMVEGNDVYYVTNRCELVCAGCARGWEQARQSELEVRHDGGSWIRAAQHVEFVAGVVWRPDFPEHGERAGREPCAYSVAECAVDYRHQQDDRTSWCGKTIRFTTGFCTGNGRRRRWGKSATWCRW